LGDLDEDKRIEAIGNAAMKLGKVVGFIVELRSGKADRYISKLQTKFPGIKIMARFNGPVKGVETVKVGPPVENN
jgi:hypothetical protein